MLKSFAFLENIWFEENVEFPLKIDKYIFRKLYESEFESKDILIEWEKSYYNSTGSHNFIIEIEEEYESKNQSYYMLSIKNLVDLLRLIKYNRVHFSTMVSLHKKRVVLSNSPQIPLPSSFLLKNEEVTSSDLKKLEQIINNIKTVIFKPKNNERVLRAFHFWNSSSCSLDFEHKAVDLFISLESLFTIPSEKESISFNLADRLAWFIGKTDSVSRKDVFKKIKKGYSVRSNIVHGIKLLEKNDLPLIKEVHILERDMLLEILYNKELLIAFSESEDKLIEYFVNLILDTES